MSINESEFQITCTQTEEKHNGHQIKETVLTHECITVISPFYPTDLGVTIKRVWAKKKRNVSLMIVTKDISFDSGEKIVVQVNSSQPSLRGKCIFLDFLYFVYSHPQYSQLFKFFESICPDCCQVI